MSSGAQWTAEIDQALAGLRDMAKILRGFFLELCAQGFTDDQALKIVIEWQCGMQRGSQDADG